MQIDIFEIVAQMINFFILLFLLNKLFYKPVTEAMEKRQEGLTQIKNEVQAKMKEANEVMETYEGKMAQIKDQERKILDEVEKEAVEKKEKLIDEYKNEANEKRRAYLNEVEEEKENFLNDIRKTLGHNAVKIASKILETISKQDLKEHVFHTFINEIQSIDNEVLKEELSSDDNPLILISAEEMTEPQKSTIEKNIKKKIAVHKDIDFEIDNNLILGYELKLETLTVHTNIKQYLEEAEKNIIKELQKKSL